MEWEKGWSWCAKISGGSDGSASKGFVGNSGCAGFTKCQQAAETLFCFSWKRLRAGEGGGGGKPGKPGGRPSVSGNR